MPPLEYVCVPNTVTPVLGFPWSIPAVCAVLSPQLIKALKLVMRVGTVSVNVATLTVELRPTIGEIGAPGVSTSPAGASLSSNRSNRNGLIGLTDRLSFAFFCLAIVPPR
jgi:hypothetical protein